jgi:hypothetical protein
MATHQLSWRCAQAAVFALIVVSQGCRASGADPVPSAVQTSPVQSVGLGAGIDDALARHRDTAADPSFLQRATSLAAQLQAMAPSEAIGAILRAAVATNDPAGRTRVAGVLSLLLYRSRSRDGKPASFDVTGLDPKVWAAEWKALVTDDRASGTDTSMTIADQYLSLNEQLFVDGMTDRARRCIDDYGEQGRDLVRRRVLGRLSGAPESQLPKYPGESTLSSAASEGLRQRLAAVTSYREMATLVRGLSMDELAGLPAIVHADPNLSARLIPIANTVASVAADDADPATRKRLATWVGKTVDPSMATDLRAYCVERCRAGQRVICLLARDPRLGGCWVTVREQGPGELPGAGIGVRPTGVYALVCAPGVYGTASWRIAPPPDTPAGQWPFVTFEGSNSDELQAYEQALAEVFSPKVEATSIALVKFQAGGFR